MKYLLVIGDGMADKPVADLGGKTPLEKASKPLMDRIASSGELGTVTNCPKPLAPGSDTAILSIFGCDPLTCYFGRAPLEAAAQGVSVPPGALAFRCNTGTVEGGGAFETLTMKSHSAGGIDGESSHRLVSDLIADERFAAALNAAGISLHPSDSYRHIAVQTGLTDDGGELTLFPPHDNIGKPLSDILPQGAGSASANAQTLTALIKLSYEILSKHPLNLKREENGLLPANVIWPWAQGTAAKLPSFEERFNKRGAVISAVPLVQGIGALQGMEVIKVDGATGELDTNYEGKANAALEAFKRGADFVALHVEAPDECTHNGDLPGKLAAIENIDSRVISPLLVGLNAAKEPYRVLLLSDHYTLTESGMHDATPVPFAIADGEDLYGATCVTGVRFTERCAADGDYLPSGVTLLTRLFSA
jgi:2,3-bisphosphoglycerate-independent phosphoglycerate mutase